MFFILVWIAAVTDGENALHTEKQFPPLSLKHLRYMPLSTKVWSSIANIPFFFFTPLTQY